MNELKRPQTEAEIHAFMSDNFFGCPGCGACFSGWNILDHVKRKHPSLYIETFLPVIKEGRIKNRENEGREAE